MAARIGVSLYEAIYLFNDEAEVRKVTSATSWLRERERENDPGPEERKEMEELEKITAENNQQLIRNLIRMLMSGELIATGFASASSPDMPATQIHPTRWSYLQPNFKRSEARGPGEVICGITVYQAKTQMQDSRKAQGRFSKASLREWYRKWIASNEATGHLPSRDEDWIAAKEALGPSVPRNNVRALRSELAPGDWTSAGRRRVKIRTKD